MTLEEAIEKFRSFGSPCDEESTLIELRDFYPLMKKAISHAKSFQSETVRLEAALLEQFKSRAELDTRMERLKLRVEGLVTSFNSQQKEFKKLQAEVKHWKTLYYNLKGTG